MNKKEVQRLFHNLDRNWIQRFEEMTLQYSMTGLPSPGAPNLPAVASGATPGDESLSSPLTMRAGEYIQSAAS